MNEADKKEINGLWKKIANSWKVLVVIVAILLFIIACIAVFFEGYNDTTGYYYAISAEDVPKPEIEIGDVTGDVIITIGSENKVANDAELEPDLKAKEEEIEPEQEKVEQKVESEIEEKQKIESEMHPEVKVEQDVESKSQPKSKAESSELSAPFNLRIEVDKAAQIGYLIWESNSDVDSFRVELSKDGTFVDLKELFTRDILASEDRVNMSLAAWVKSDGFLLRVVAIRGEEEVDSEALKIESSDFPLFPSAQFRVLPSGEKGVVVLDGSFYNASKFRVIRGISEWDGVEWLSVSKLKANEHFFNYSWQLPKDSDSGFISIQFRNEYGDITARSFFSRP